MNVNSAVKSLVHYAQKNNMIEKDDEIWAINSLCEALGLDSFEDCEAEDKPLEEILTVC